MQIISSRCPRVLVDIIPGRYYSIIIPGVRNSARINNIFSTISSLGKSFEYILDL